MNASEKKELVVALIDNCKTEILSKIDQMPEEWNGHELRLFVRDYFAGVVWKGTTSPARVRAYNNTIRVKNLL